MTDAENEYFSLKGCLMNSDKLNPSISSLWLMVSKALDGSMHKVAVFSIIKTPK